MGQKIDITNQKFGKLTALYPTEKRTKGGGIYWMFICDCGKRKECPANSARSGLIKSCGCEYRKHGEAHNKSRLYNIWVNMRMRCKPYPVSDFNRYWGAKGIKVCDEWQEYIAFRNWALSNGYDEKLTIDRIDGNKDYCPNNCRWVTPKVQSNNEASNHKITIDGTTHNLNEWLDILQTVSKATFHRRIREGWDEISALTTPPLRKKVSNG